MIEDYLKMLLDTKYFKLLLVFIAFDIFFGVLRAIKERKFNSCIGINGLIRKTGMIASSVFLFCIDNLLQFNFIGFIPEIIRSTIKINFIGIGGLFSILFIVFESLSILKNMYLCNLPIPKKLHNFLTKVLKEFTQEIEEDKGENNNDN